MFPLEPDQMAAVRDLNERIRSAEVPFEQVDCICGGGEFREIAGTDRYGMLQATAICVRCGLVQSNPRMTEDAYRDFYESDTYRRIYDGNSFLERYQAIYRDGRGEGVFSRVTGQRPASKIASVLEFGAGGGWNLVPFIRAGIPATGYDLSPELVELGRSKGVDLIQGSLDEIEGTYDVVLMIQVLEHLPDVPGTLARLSAHLSPGGMLFVEVPDIEQFVTGQIQNAHTYYFSRKTLEFSASQAGLELVHCALEPAQQITAAFVPSDRAPISADALAGHYEQMVARVRRYERGVRRRARLGPAVRVLDSVGLTAPIRRVLGASSGR
jgi:2-polyprenyl-3-methyl-5-hydroxy-6-metoxy-1,4-benzoquinol methylase